jgi:hypothetical protein
MVHGYIHSVTIHSLPERSAWTDLVHADRTYGFVGYWKARGAQASQWTIRSFARLAALRHVDGSTPKVCSIPQKRA